MHPLSSCLSSGGTLDPSRERATYAGFLRRRHEELDSALCNILNAAQVPKSAAWLMDGPVQWAPQNPRRSLSQSVRVLFQSIPGAQAHVCSAQSENFQPPGHIILLFFSAPRQTRMSGELSSRPFWLKSFQLMQAATGLPLVGLASPKHQHQYEPVVLPPPCAPSTSGQLFVKMSTDSLTTSQPSLLHRSPLIPI